ncbi:MAG: ankyrin repeat domain-containing protein [Bacteroidota bacterium]
MSKVIFFLSLSALCFSTIAMSFGRSLDDEPANEFNEDLLMAIYNGNVDSVAILLEHEASPNSTDYLGNSALIYAVQGGYEEIVVLLIDAGADIDYKGYLGRSPIIEAARFNYFSVAEILCSANADVNAEDSYGNTALFYASAFGEFYLTDLLIFYGANVNHKNKKEITSLHIACWYGHPEIAGLLLDYGAEINAADEFGNTPLLVTAFASDINMLWYMIESGADLLMLNNDNLDVFTIAAFKRDYEMFEFLLEYEIIPEQYPNKYYSPAGIALFYEDRQLLNIISEHKFLKPKGLYFTHMVYEPLFHFNNNEFMFGAQGGIFESRFDVALSLGFQSRINPRQILIEKDENVFVQYWEIRRHWFVSLEKQHTLLRFNEFRFGFNYGIRGAYTYGSYRGTESNPVNKFLAAPSAGVFVGSSWLRLSFKYEYMPLMQNNISNNRYNIGLQFKIPLYNLDYYNTHYYID